MVWVHPCALNQNPNTSEPWHTRQRNDYFLLQINLTGKWRILLSKKGLGSNDVLLAEDLAEESIMKDWQWIEHNMLRKISLLEEEDANKIYQYIVLQFQVPHPTMSHLFHLN